MVVMRGARDSKQALTSTVGRGSRKQVEGLDCLIICFGSEGKFLIKKLDIHLFSQAYHQKITFYA